MTESFSPTESQDAPQPQRSTEGPRRLVADSQPFDDSQPFGDSQCWVVSNVDGLRIRERASKDSRSVGHLDDGQSLISSCEARRGAHYPDCGGSRWWIPVPYKGRTHFVAWACVDWFTSESPPQPRRTYTVKRGDTLGGIARRFGVSLSDLVEANPQITDPDLIFPGQVIEIPE